MRFKKYALDEIRFDDIAYIAPIFGKMFGNAGFVVSIIDTDYNLLYMNDFGKVIFTEKHPEDPNFKNKKCYHFFRKEKEVCRGCPTEKVIECNMPSIDCTIHNKLVDRVFKVSSYPVVDWADEKQKEKKLAGIIEIAEDTTFKFMSAGKAHDANNLLAGIVGPLSYVEHCLKNNQISKEDILYNITSAQESARKITENVRDLQNILSGKTRWDDYTRTELDLQAILQYTINQFTFGFKQNNVKIVTELNDKDIPFLAGHAKGLESVFENLISNALKACTKSPNPESQVTVRLYYTPDPKPERGGYVCIDIEDNGIGMTPDVKKQIFDPHYTTDEKSGSGIGLTIAKQIIEKRHRGNIIVESEYYKGSKFTVLLPDPKKEKTISTSVIISQ